MDDKGNEAMKEVEITSVGKGVGGETTRGGDNDNTQHGSGEPLGGSGGAGGG